MRLGYFLAKFSIRKQILMGFAPFLVTLILLAIISHANSNYFLNQAEKLKLATDEITLILEIEKDMLGLQRNVIVYSYIGYSGVIRKIRFLEQIIESRLVILKKMLEDDSAEARELFSRLYNHYKGYKEGFEDVIHQRAKLIKIMDKKAVPIHKKLQASIQELIKYSHDNDYKAEMLANDISRDLLRVRVSFSAFLSVPDASIIGDTRVIIKRISANITLLHHQIQSGKINEIETLSLSFEQVFLEMVNINRGYLSLINVVLPGKASEIDKLTTKLDTLERKELKKVNMNINKNMQSAKNNYILLSIFAAIVGMSSASLIALSISKPVKKITETLTKLSKGEKNINIPGLNRSDEVGEMAMAANDFQITAHSLEKKTNELQIANDEANKAQEQAENANRTKGEFLATMSHEIRTPMNGIFGMGELIISSGLGCKQEKYMQILMNSAESLLVVLDDILDFSKIEAGKLELDPIPINLQKLMEDITTILVIKAEEKGLEILMHYDSNLPVFIIADPVRVRQVITNLISNAIKFTAKGHIFLRAESINNKEVGVGRVYVKISVEDTGIGIPLENQGQLFDKFTQADSSTTRKFGGTGLGLAICKQLAELMGGEIGLKSIDNEGSVFWFTMLLEACEQEQYIVEDNNVTIDIENITFAGTKILVAEDNAVNQEIVKEILKATGCEVHIVINGEQAVKSALETEYDLILMDCQMPIMDGFEASQKLSEAKARKDMNDIPIIALTANVMKGDKEACLAAGMQDYISKPVRKHQIIVMLDKWLNPSNN